METINELTSALSQYFFHKHISFDILTISPFPSLPRFPVFPKPNLPFVRSFLFIHRGRPVPQPPSRSLRPRNILRRRIRPKINFLQLPQTSRLPLPVRIAGNTRACRMSLCELCG